jgi:hypothetical protein
MSEAMNALDVGGVQRVITKASCTCCLSTCGIWSGMCWVVTRELYVTTLQHMPGFYLNNCVSRDSFQIW